MHFECPGGRAPTRSGAVADVPADPIVNVGTGEAVQARTLDACWIRMGGTGGGRRARLAAVGEVEWQQPSIDPITAQLGWSARRSLAEAASGY